MANNPHHPRAVAAVALLASLALPASSVAAAPRVPLGGLRAHLRPPMELPGDARAARAGDWLVGAQPGARATAIARRHGARELLVRGSFRVPTGAARALAADLRRAGLLRYAEPNVKRRRAAAFEGKEDAWARGAVVPSALGIPAPTVPIGFVDDRVDPGVADLAQNTTYANEGPVNGPHGTETASNAAAPRNGLGVVGIFPGAPIISYGTDLTCADVANGIIADVKLGARVINLSLGSASDCTAEFYATQVAYGAGALVVASAGNEFSEGNPAEYPSSYPHVLSVAAVDEALQPSFFSNKNAAIDVAAPGENVPVDVPLQFDTRDGAQDGVTVNDGTSFSSPIVAGAAAFVMASKPGIGIGQVADLLRNSALDVAAKGYDAATGYGLVNIPAALQAPVPAVDPLEPNDDIPSVSGVIFGKPDKPVFTGTKERTIRATVDATEDPIDVYRVTFPAKAAISIRLTATGGDCDLYAFDRSAKSFADDPVDSSRRGRGRQESIRLVNPTGRARTGYIVVDGPTLRETNLGARYRLTLKRVRRGR